ncbi:hypothetical protein Tco_0030822 [Tanacetum coccineum]
MTSHNMIYELLPASSGASGCAGPLTGGKVTSGLSALRSVESRCNCDDEVGSGMDKIGGVPDGGVPDDGVSAMVRESMICGGGEWEVDGALALSRIIVAR